MTALHWAAYHDDLETAKLLVDARANVKAANRYGVTPLSLACTNGNEAIVDALARGRRRSRTPRSAATRRRLMTAARTGKLGPVQGVARPRGRRQRQGTARADGPDVGRGRGACGRSSQALLEAGADFRTPLPSGFTPLFFAVREGRTDVVRVLLKAGADVNEAMQPQEDRRARRPAGGPAR